MSNLKSESSNATLEIALTVLEHGWATIKQLRSANEWRFAQRPRLGKLARNACKLNQSQVLAVLEEQRNRGKMFGEAAIDLGFMDLGDVCELLLVQAEFTPSLIDALLEHAAITKKQAELMVKALISSNIQSVSAVTSCEAVLN